MNTPQKKTPRVVSTYLFKSSSSDAIYQTLVWDDNRITCDCPGWTRRKIRTCKHVRLVEASPILARQQALNNTPNLSAPASACSAPDPGCVEFGQRPLVFDDAT